MNKNGLWTILKKQLMIGQAKDGEKPKLTKYHYFLFVFVLGVSFMLVSQLFSSPEKTGKDQTAQTVMSGRTEDKSGQKSAPVFKASKDGSAKTTIDDYERDYENQLKEILETIIGVEDVSIVVNVDATSLKVFEKNKTKKTPPLKKPIKKAAKEA